MTIEQVNTYAQIVVSHLKSYRGYDVKLGKFCQMPHTTNCAAELSLRLPGNDYPGASTSVPLVDFSIPLSDQTDAAMLSALDQRIATEYKWLRRHLPPLKLSDVGGTLSLDLGKLWGVFNGDSGEIWEAYLSGGFDEDLRSCFERSIPPHQMEMAIIIRGFMGAIKP